MVFTTLITSIRFRFICISAAFALTVSNKAVAATLKYLPHFDKSTTISNNIDTTKLGLLGHSLITDTDSNSTNTATQGMVVTQQRLASQVGLQILREGGNAVDAAVAVGYALAVVDPCCGNLGGGGFMTIDFEGGKNTFINFREKAPVLELVELARLLLRAKKLKL